MKSSIYLLLAGKYEGGY